jgi:peptidoglycan/LPS O-acetylase OafA/YrhL
MELKDAILLLHPAIAVIVVFPLIGIVVNRAFQVRQRRLQTIATAKSKIPPVVGQEHVQLGRWLTGAVVGIVLLALSNDVFGNIIEKQIWTKSPFQVIFAVLLLAATIGSLFLLYRANNSSKWRGIFATLTGVGLVVLGCQDGVYRKTDQWYISHYYYGQFAALLMIFSLAILPDIYKDKTNFWRKVHIIFNCIALLLFIGQGITGTRALLEVPLSWQEPYVNMLYQQKCDTNVCTIQAPSIAPKP